MATNNPSFIIADTSAIFSLINPLDTNHRTAKAVAEGFEHKTIPLIIPWDIFVETINVVGKRLGHAKAIAVAEYLQNTSRFTLVDAPQNARHAALEKFQQQPSSVSFTDCIVMALADEYETKVIFGFDRVFMQNGYHTLPLHPAI